MSDTETSAPKPSLDGLLLVPDEAGTAGTKRSDSTATSARDLVFKTSGATALAPVISIDRLWEAAPGTTSQMVRALELLKEASDNLTQAKSCNDPRTADRFVQRVQVGLPRLFACRSIGDGFGVIVNSIHFAFANLQGAPLNQDQINALWRVVRELRNKPAMTLQQGIERVSQLEETGLEVDPADLESLVEGSAEEDEQGLR